MRLHIDKRKSPEMTLRSILKAHIVPAIDELKKPDRDSLARTVHDVRKRVKKMRSALRLFRAAHHPEITKADHRPLRDASREIAPVRDAHVNLRTMRRLCRYFDIVPAHFWVIFQFLEQQEARACAESTVSLRRATDLLATTNANVTDAGIRLKSRELRDGLARIYKRGRKAFRKAVDDISAENLHRWRKRTKDIFYDLSLTASPHPKVVHKLAHRAKDLGTLLGEEHDLALLQQTLKESGLETTSLEPLIAVRRLRLQKRIIKSGTDFFFRKPEAFIRQFAH